MKIYRLERTDGRGVYSVLYGVTTKEEYGGGPGSRHPAPWRDSEFCKNHFEKLGKYASDCGFAGKYVFGFGSPEQLLRRFFNRDDLRTLMVERDIQVSVYECADVIEGNTQVAFGVWHHTLFAPVAVFSPVEFYDLYAGKSQESNRDLPDYKKHVRRFPAEVVA